MDSKTEGLKKRISEAMKELDEEQRALDDILRFIEGIQDAELDQMSGSASSARNRRKKGMAKSMKGKKEEYERERERKRKRTSGVCGRRYMTYRSKRGSYKPRTLSLLSERDYHQPQDQPHFSFSAFDSASNLSNLVSYSPFVLRYWV